LALSIKHTCEIIDHVLKTFSLLSDTGEEDVLFYLGLLVHCEMINKNYLLVVV
jgi:hypothetical protein